MYAVIASKTSNKSAFTTTRASNIPVKFIYYIECSEDNTNYYVIHEVVKLDVVTILGMYQSVLGT